MHTVIPTCLRKPRTPCTARPNAVSKNLHCCEPAICDSRADSFTPKSSHSINGGMVLHCVRIVSHGYPSNKKNFYQNIDDILARMINAPFPLY